MWEPVSPVKDFKHFTNLEVWRRAHKLFVDVLADFEAASKQRRWGIDILGRQVVRSVGSIGANIAEGFNAGSTREYVRYLDIARRSAAESENWYYKIRDAAFVPPETCKLRLREIIEIQKMTRGLQRSLRRNAKTI